MKEWIKEFFYIRVKNGSCHSVRSGTKALKSIVGFLVVGLVSLIFFAFVLKLFSTEADETLTTEVLDRYIALGGVVSILFGWLQKNYTTHKKNSIEADKPGEDPESSA